MGVSRDCPIFWIPPIISETGNAKNFKFCTHIHRIARNKSPLKISGQVTVGLLRDSRKFSGHVPIYRAHRAVIFAIARLSCYHWDINRSLWEKQACCRCLYERCNYLIAVLFLDWWWSDFVFLWVICVNVTVDAVRSVQSQLRWETGSRYQLTTLPMTCQQLWSRLLAV